MDWFAVLRMPTAIMSGLLALSLPSYGMAFSEGSPLFHFTEVAGPYAVGLRVIEQYDYTRVYRYGTDELGIAIRGERARPLQTLIWYPADATADARMTVADYAKLLESETDFLHPKTTSREREWLSAMAPALATQLWAVRDAPVAPGRFPVVIYAPSFSSMSWENADLCEYLASHGYLVIASPNMGEMSREMTANLAGVNAQARDISFLVGFARTLADADTSEIGVVGFSWGGLANVFAAARDNRIAALVALDGSLRYFPNLVREADDVHPEQMTIPLLYFAQGEITLENQARYFLGVRNQAPNVLNAWTHGDLVLIRMLGLAHREFSSMFQRNEELWKEANDAAFPEGRKADYGREDGIPGYAWVARYTLAFVDAYLKHDRTAAGYLEKSPAENGVPRHFMTVDYRAAVIPAPSFAGFRAAVGQKGFAHLDEVYAAIRKEDAKFELDVSAVISWSNELIDADRVAEAVHLLEFNAQLHPASGAAHLALGDAYRKAGQKSSAIGSHQRALEQDPTNAEARRKLKELEDELRP